MAYGVYSDRGYREHILARNKNTNKTEVFTQEDQTFTGRKTFLSGVTTSDLEVQTVEVSESLKVKGKDITEIIDYLPNDVSKENKLTTKDFVNSSISTNTANFLGTFNTLEEIEALTDVTNNDYAFWKTTDTLGSVVFKRYKYIADEQLWKFEYDLNNSSFTAAQWDAINSGITEELVSQIGQGASFTAAQWDAINSGITEELVSQIGQGSGGVICNTEATVQNKKVNINGFVLEAGAVVRVLFANANSAANPTLNVSYDGSSFTGAKAIKAVKAGQKIAPPVHSGKWRGATEYTDEMWQPYTTLELIYDGTDWVIMGNPEFENWSNDTEGYTVLANGYIEQWIRANCGSNAFNYLIKYLIAVPMINATIMDNADGATTSMVRSSTLNDFICHNQNGYNSGTTAAITAFVIRGY